MKLEVEMYVRTKYGIRKIIEIDEDNNYYIDKNYTNDFRQEINCISDSCIIGEPSFNIIDLIEVGDYVNGYKIEKVYNSLNEHNGICNSLDTYLWEVNDLDEFKEIVIFENDIKSVITHEQMKQMSYKIEE